MFGLNPPCTFGTNGEKYISNIRLVLLVWFCKYYIFLLPMNIYIYIYQTFHYESQSNRLQCHTVLIKLDVMLQLRRMRSKFLCTCLIDSMNKSKVRKKTCLRTLGLGMFITRQQFPFEIGDTAFHLIILSHIIITTVIFASHMRPASFAHILK